jgi:hypothetical protein
MGGTYEYAAEMGSEAKFHEDWFMHSKYDRGRIHRHTAL